MSDLPKTRKWNVRRKSAFMDQVQTDLDLADAMRDELLARIGELEQQLILVSNRQDAIRAEQAEAALADIREQLRLCNIDQFNAEAALAERDRMLEDACRQMCGLYLYSGWAWEPILADLRARAEEGSKDE